MPPAILRKPDIWLLRNYPHLWSLQAHWWFLEMTIVMLMAWAVASWTSIDLHDLPDISRACQIWLGLAVLPLLHWAVLFLRINQPVLRKGAGKRAAMILGTSWVVASSLLPAVVAAHTLEQRTLSYIDEHRFEVDLYICVDRLRASPRATLELTAQAKELCPVDYVYHAEDRLRRMSERWDDPTNLVGRRSRAVAIAIAKDHDFVDTNIFRYRSEPVFFGLVFALGWLAYVVHVGRLAGTTFGLALAAIIGALLCVWGLSTVHVHWWTNEWVAACLVVLFVLGIAAFPAELGKHRFWFELFVCILPLLGFVYGLSLQLDQLALFKLAATVCWVFVVLSPVLHYFAERLRSRPA
jgi:hypothetical protein